ncbi:MAG: peptidase M23, partial [Alphaproteobacteria bacterium]|nr:peptidase M23 [Alphaproteobacteria bacterium]
MIRPVGIRSGAALMAGALLLAACDVGSVAMWPWVGTEEVAETEVDPNAPPPPPPPINPVDPLDPATLPEPETIPNPGGNPGAPEAGTPFAEAPVNETIPISDTIPPVSADTGQPVDMPPPVEEPGLPGQPVPADPAPADPAPADPAPAPEPARPAFLYFASGSLEPGSGTGSAETAALVPDMAFPIKDAPAFPQSQVYRFGGGVKGGDQCDVRNFTAPWRDNFCENRSTTATTPFCTRTGVHLGQDIRVGTPEGCKVERST